MMHPDTPLTDLIGRTVHVTRGQKHYGEYRVTGIEIDLGPEGCQLRGVRRSPLPDVTGEWLPEVIVPTNVVDVHLSRSDATACIRERRAAAKRRREEAGPPMMAATDGNIMAMLMGATRRRSV
jgi:hypothetical protein